MPLLDAWWPWLAVAGVGALHGLNPANGWLFAAAYCSMQLGRSLYVVWASWGIHDGRVRNFARIAFWSLLTLPLWIAGCFADTRKAGPLGPAFFVSRAVMAGLVPAIHVGRPGARLRPSSRRPDVDARHEAGHDDWMG